MKSEAFRKVVNLSAVGLLGLSAFAGVTAGVSEVQRSYAQGAADAYHDVGHDKEADKKQAQADSREHSRNSAIPAIIICGMMGGIGVARWRRA